MFGRQLAHVAARWRARRIADAPPTSSGSSGGGEEASCWLERNT